MDAVAFGHIEGGCDTSSHSLKDISKSDTPSFIANTFITNCTLLFIVSCTCNRWMGQCKGRSDSKISGRRVP